MNSRPVSVSKKVEPVAVSKTKQAPMREPSKEKALSAKKNKSKKPRNATKDLTEIKKLGPRAAKLEVKQRIDESIKESLQRKMERKVKRENGRKIRE